MEQPTQTGTIHTAHRDWTWAEIVGRGKDTLTGTEDVLVVRHAAFRGEMQFYATPEEGRYYNVGNRAVWLTIP